MRDCNSCEDGTLDYSDEEDGSQIEPCWRCEGTGSVDDEELEYWEDEV